MNTLALQLYTVRDETARDFAGTLRRVAAQGYTAVEFAGYGDLSSQQMQELLAETGLQALSAHVALTRLEQNLAQEIEYAQAIGCSYIVMPWLAPEQRTGAHLPALAEILNTMGSVAKASGLTLGYHNHDFEFAPVSATDPSFMLDYLLENTDPANLVLELDTYWAAYAGVDPVAYLQRWQSRVPLVHLKDMTPERTFTEVGAGTLPIAAIVAAAQAAGTQGYIVENDQPRIPSLESARQSLQFLQTLPALS
ncbi:MAG TPA: sugar phosphate isomerase/epimerase [Ktedonobacteraceae bacterium]